MQLDTNRSKTFSDIKIAAKKNCMSLFENSNLFQIVIDFKKENFAKRIMNEVPGGTSSIRHITSMLNLLLLIISESH